MSRVNTDLGLVAWGMKLGKQTFFSVGYANGGSPIDDKSKEIENTLEDLRGIIKIPYVDEVFYSLEFTNTEKVYTIYKTIHDWANRTSSFLALSLFVPHDVEVTKGVSVALNSLLAIYDKEYIDIL